MTVFWQTETSNSVPQICLEGWPNLTQLPQKNWCIWAWSRSPPFRWRGNFGGILRGIPCCLDQVLQSRQPIAEGTYRSLQLLELGSNLLQNICKSALHLHSNCFLQLLFRNFRRPFSWCRIAPVAWSGAGWTPWPVHVETAKNWRFWKVPVVIIIGSFR